MIFYNYIGKWSADLLFEKQELLVDVIKKPNNLTPQALISSSNDDSRIITDVRLEKDGTVRTYLKGMKEPLRYYSDYLTVYTVSYYKRLFSLIFRNVSEMNWMKRIITLLAIKFNFNILPEWLNHIFCINRVLLNDENYSQPAKEIRRVLNGKVDEMLKNGIGIIVESDSAYRYRMQDVVSQINKKELLKNPVKEICRLFDILIERDEDYMKIKWRTVKKFTKLVLITSPKIKKLVVGILMDINIDEIKFSKEDIYWVNEFGKYNYFGKTLEQRKEDNKIKYAVDLK
jgi:hypothetical protein